VHFFCFQHPPPPPPTHFFSSSVPEHRHLKDRVGPGSDLFETQAAQLQLSQRQGVTFLLTTSTAPQLVLDQSHMRPYISRTLIHETLVYTHGYSQQPPLYGVPTGDKSPDVCARGPFSTGRVHAMHTFFRRQDCRAIRGDTGIHCRTR